MADSLSVEIALPKAREFTRVRLHLSGSMPALEVDGQRAAEWLPLWHTYALSVGDAPFALAEIKLWGRRRPQAADALRTARNQLLSS